MRRRRENARDLRSNVGTSICKEHCLGRLLSTNQSSSPSNIFDRHETQGTDHTATHPSTHTHTHTHTPIHAPIHTHTHIHPDTHPHKCTHIHTHAHARTHTPINSHISEFNYNLMSPARQIREQCVYIRLLSDLCNVSSVFI